MLTDFVQALTLPRPVKGLLFFVSQPKAGRSESYDRLPPNKEEAHVAHLWWKFLYVKVSPQLQA